MFVELGTAIASGTAANLVIDNRNSILSVPGELVDWLRNGRKQIFVFGSAGTVKSTLAGLLSGAYKHGEVPSKYSLSVDIEQSKIQGTLLGKITAAPGQHEKRQYAWPLIAQELIKGGPIGVISCVSWGYHSLARTEYKESRSYESGITEKQFLEKYLENSRSDEVDALLTLKPFIESVPGKLWMITLVTMQDLWWDRRYEVKKHYENGQYDNLITEIRRKRGDMNFNHIYSSVCLNHINMRTQDEILLAKTTEGYDSHLMARNFQETMQQIKMLMG